MAEGQSHPNVMTVFAFNQHYYTELSSLHGGGCGRCGLGVQESIANLIRHICDAGWGVRQENSGIPADHHPDALLVEILQSLYGRCMLSLHEQ